MHALHLQWTDEAMLDIKTTVQTRVISTVMSASSKVFNDIYVGLQIGIKHIVTWFSKV